MFGKLFNRNRKNKISGESHADKDMSIDKEIEHIFNSIKKVTKKYSGEKECNFRGLTEPEIEALEKEYEMIFPKAYKYFLRKYAAGELQIFDNQTYDAEGIAEAREVSKDLLSQDKITLPSNYFAFSQWQGYQFYYFINSGADNPDTFLYIEGGNDPNLEPPEIYPLGCFTDWLVNITIENIKAIRLLRDGEIEGWMKTLESLLKNGR